jgi:hypothetical protein
MMERTSASGTFLESDGTAVAFQVFAGGREVHCLITRDALEQFFWLPAQATEARVLKAFTDGRGRIVALAVRMALRDRSDSLTVTASDFQR